MSSHSRGSPKVADLKAGTEQVIANVFLEYSKLKAHIERYIDEIPLEDGTKQNQFVF